MKIHHLKLENKLLYCSDNRKGISDIFPSLPHLA